CSSPRARPRPPAGARSRTSSWDDRGRPTRAAEKEERMPYDSVKHLPASVTKVLPKHAQEIYKEAFNSAWEQYDEPAERRGGADREETAHKVAWAAVKQSYEKAADGAWR